MTEDTQTQAAEAAQLVKEKLSDDNGKLACEINEDQADYTIQLTENELADLSFALSIALARIHEEEDGDTELSKNVLNVKNRITYTTLTET